MTRTNEVKQDLQSKNINAKQIRSELAKIKPPHKCKNCSGNHLYVNCTAETPRCHLDNLRHRVGDRKRCEIWRTIKNSLTYTIKMQQHNINPHSLSAFKLADYMIYDKDPQSRSDIPASLQPQIPKNVTSSKINRNDKNRDNLPSITKTNNNYSSPIKHLRKSVPSSINTNTNPSNIQKQNKNKNQNQNQNRNLNQQQHQHQSKNQNQNTKSSNNIEDILYNFSDSPELDMSGIPQSTDRIPKLSHIHSSNHPKENIVDSDEEDTDMTDSNRSSRKSRSNPTTNKKKSRSRSRSKRNKPKTKTNNPKDRSRKGSSVTQP